MLDLTFDLLGRFEFPEFAIRLSTRPEKAVGSDEQWNSQRSRYDRHWSPRVQV